MNRIWRNAEYVSLSTVPYKLSLHGFRVCAKYMFIVTPTPLILPIYIILAHEAPNHNTSF